MSLSLLSIREQSPICKMVPHQFESRERSSFDLAAGREPPVRCPLTVMRRMAALASRQRIGLIDEIVATPMFVGGH